MSQARPMNTANDERMDLVFRAIADDGPGDQWQAQVARHWPALRSWVATIEAPPLATAQRMLATHMPELVPLWRRLVATAGITDPLLERTLTHVGLPPVHSGCTQGAVDGTLVRNLDYDLRKCEGTIWSSQLGARRVIGVTSGLWGLLDGVNDAGLAVAFAFGGRRCHGLGFSAALIVRYLLETCDNVRQVERALENMPVALSMNLTAVDSGGGAASFFLAPREPCRRAPDVVVANHQEHIDWPGLARATETVGRAEALGHAIAKRGTTAADVVGALLEPPLFRTDYRGGFGTVYTVAYRPAAGEAEFVWRDQAWRLRIDAFEPGTRTLSFPLSPSHPTLRMGDVQ